MPSSAGVRTTSPPSRRIIRTRSPLTVFGIYARNRTPTVAHTMLNAMDVEPLDASTTTVEEETSPDSMACATMFVAIRSLVHPLGSKYSSFNQRVHPVRSSWNGTVGVSSGNRSSHDALSASPTASRFTTTSDAPMTIHSRRARDFECGKGGQGQHATDCDWREA